MVPTSSDYRDLYERLAQERGDMAQHYLHYAPARRLQVTLDLIRTIPWASALDAGCGDGVLLAQMRSMASQRGGRPLLCGIDLSELRLRRARERADVGLSLSDVSALPFRDGSFDLVVCTEVVEHVPDFRGAIRELARVTAASGHVIVSIPVAGWDRSLRSLRGRPVVYLDTVEHLREWAMISIPGFERLRDFFAQLRQEGLSVTAARGAYIFGGRLECHLDRVACMPKSKRRRLADAIDEFAGWAPLRRSCERYLVRLVRTSAHEGGG